MNDMADLVGEARGKTYFDKFRAQIVTLVDREVRLLETRRREFTDAQNIAAEKFGIVQSTSGWVAHTHEVISNALQILNDAVDMETGLRGFLLAGEDEFLEPYKDKEGKIFTDITVLQKTVSDNPAQVRRLDGIRDVIRVWIETVARPAIALRREIAAGRMPFKAIDVLVSKKQGKQHFDSLRGLIKKFEDVELALLAQRNGEAADAAQSVLTNIDLIKANEKWVAHTYTVINKVQELLTAALNIETGMRGYLLSGEDSFLNP